MSDLEDRLKIWFAGEVSRAERDLVASKVRTAPLRHGRAIPRLAVAGVLVALVVVAVALRPIVAPNTGKGPQGSPTSTPVESGGLIAFDPDGLPAIIDGEPVLRVEEARGRILASGVPLLVAGWYAASGQRCAAVIRDPHPLTRSCGNGRLLPARDPGAQGGLEIVESPRGIENGLVALRLHTRDPRAATCETSQRARCEAAIVADEIVWQNPDPMNGRFADGIPGGIDDKPVNRAADAREFADAHTDATPFLLGGWYVGPRPVSCPAPMDPHPLAWSCGPALLGERPGSGALVLGPGPEISEGPVVIAAHVHDPAANGCLPENRARCQMTIVVDRLVWAGDEVTRTAPLGIQDVVTAMRQDIAGFTVAVDQPSRTCDPGWPRISWVSKSAPGVTNVMVFPTTADREAVDQNFRSSGWTGIDGCSVDTYGDPWHWVAVDNVMVSTTEALADRTRMRLEGIAP